MGETSGLEKLDIQPVILHSFLYLRGHNVSVISRIVSWSDKKCTSPIYFEISCFTIMQDLSHK